MASGPITSWPIDGETMETVSDFIFLASTITADGDCIHEIKRHLLFGRKVMTNLDSILKNRDITVPTKVHLVKAMIFPVVMYGCESWTIKLSAEEFMLLNYGVGEDSWESLGLQGDPTSQSRLLCPWKLSRKEYWSGLPCPPPADLPNPGIEPRSPELQADSLPAELPGNPNIRLPVTNIRLRITLNHQGSPNPYLFLCSHCPILCYWGSLQISSLFFWCFDIPFVSEGFFSFLPVEKF